MPTDHATHTVLRIQGCDQCYPDYEAQLRERDERIRKLVEAVSAAWDYRAMLPEWWADKAEPLLGEG